MTDISEVCLNMSILRPDVTTQFRKNNAETEDMQPEICILQLQAGFTIS